MYVSASFGNTLKDLTGLKEVGLVGKPAEAFGCSYVAIQLALKGQLSLLLSLEISMIHPENLMKRKFKENLDLKNYRKWAAFFGNCLGIGSGSGSGQTRQLPLDHFGDKAILLSDQDVKDVQRYEDEWKRTARDKVRVDK